MLTRILSYFWVRNNAERMGVALILSLALI
jgi:hypothetical protein